MLIIANRAMNTKLKVLAVAAGFPNSAFDYKLLT